MKQIVLVEATNTYSDITADIIKEAAKEERIEVNVVYFDVVDLLATLEIGIKVEVLIYDDMLDPDGELLELALEVNPDMEVIITSSTMKNLMPLLEKHNLSESIWFTMPYRGFDNIKSIIRKAIKTKGGI